MKRSTGWLKGGLALLVWVVCVAAQIPPSRPAAETPRPASIRVVTHDALPPLSFIDEDGRLKGARIDLWAAWQQKTGIRVDFQRMEWSQALAALEAGTVDVIDTITRTPTREARYEFSEPYIELDVALFFNRRITGVVDAASVRRFVVGVRAGDACIEHLQAQGVVNLQHYPDSQMLIAAAQAGAIQVFCMPEPPASYLLYRAGLAADFLRTPSLYKAPGHWAVRKGETGLQRLVAQGFAQITPGERQKIDDKWFGATLVGQTLPAYVRDAGYTVLALVALAAVLVVWGQMLRRQVAARTRDLSQALGDLQQAQQELQRHRESLEDLVAARTAELASANLEQQAIFDATSAGIFLIRDRVILRCNRRADLLLGYEAGEQIGRPTRIWFADDASHAAVGQDLNRVWSGETYVGEWECVRKDGSRLWVRESSHAVDAMNPARGVVVTLSDITAERRAMEEMRRARDLAEDAVHTKSNFVANMSHEIRTPMNAIIGMAHLVLKTELTPRQRDYLHKIQRSSQHLLGIINDILDLSKLEAGKLVVEHIAFNLDHMLDNVTNLIAEKAGEKGLELIIDVAPEVPPNLVGDPLRLGQVLVNFASNAVKFTQRGEVAIRISVAGRQHQRIVLRCEVSDTGIGLSAEQCSRLFRNFEQADASTTRQYGGTGLGLVISKRLVELMDGEVGVVSEPGVGSTFWFTVALEAGAEAPRDHLPAPDLRGRRMLVVDDNEHVCEVICDQLRSMSFVVASAASGAEAIAELTRAAAAGTPYHLVFLDWQMPQMDGIATAHAIRRLGLSPVPHLVMITAYGRDELLRPSHDAGIEHVLIKPVNASLLFDTVIQVLGDTGDDMPTLMPDLVPASGLAAISGARILLVEDNELNQEVAAELLRDDGFRVDIAADGAQALHCLAGPTRYDIVLMDMQMPVMDGLTATREIRKQPRHAELPIVAMTANAMQRDRDRCLAAGMNDHLAKPIDPEQLRARLVHWIRPRPPASMLAPIVVDVPASPPPPASPTPAASPELPTAIEGLDLVTGLRQALGRKALYCSLLGKFVTSQRDFPARVAAAVAAADWPLAERLAHTLKGVAAQIGAAALREQAARLEQALRQQASVGELTGLRNAVEACLLPLLAAIEHSLPPDPAAAPRPAVDVARLREVCSQLAQRLGEDDFAAGQLLEAHEALLRNGLGAHFTRIADALAEFNFALALERLNAAAQAHDLRW